MKAADRRCVVSMIKAIERFQNAQYRMSGDGWAELNDAMFDLDGMSTATWNDIGAFKEDLKSLLGR